MLRPFQLLPCLHKYVFIENDIVFNENATIVSHLHIVFHIVFMSFLAFHTKMMKTIETIGNLLFASQDNLNILNMFVFVDSVVSILFLSLSCLES